MTQEMPEIENKEQKEGDLFLSLTKKLQKAVAGTLAAQILLSAVPSYAPTHETEILDSSGDICEYIDNINTLINKGDKDQAGEAYFNKVQKHGMALEILFGKENLRFIIPVSHQQEASIPEKIPTEFRIAEEHVDEAKRVESALQNMDRTLLRSVDKIILQDKTLLGEKELKESSVKDGISDSVILGMTQRGQDGRGIITLLASSDESIRSQLESILQHEIAHTNDWYSNQLDTASKIELLSTIINRLADASRFYSGYVEAINNKDSKIAILMKAREYWAEIVAQYFYGKSALPAKDKAVVEHFLSIITSHAV